MELEKKIENKIEDLKEEMLKEADYYRFSKKKYAREILKELIEDSYRDIIEEEINKLKKDINDFKFIGNTECYAYKVTIEKLELLEKIKEGKR